MKRLGWIAAAVAALAGLLAAVAAGGNPPVRIDVAFDTAKGMVPGQSVKIAGVRVGKLQSVHVEHPRGRYVARVELSVDARYAPFHDDATCRILPQGLISENYIECDPGSPTRPVLADGPSGVPTVPLDHTSVPASLQDLLEAFSAPASQRLAVLLSQLGVATAGRGDDINAILRRSNPALTQTNRMLTLLAAQRRHLVAAIGQSDRVMAAIASRDRDVRRFVNASADLTSVTALHARAMGEGVRRLPAMLTAIERELAPVRKLTRSGKPLLAELRAAGPGLTGFTQVFPRFAARGVPALRSLATAAAAGRRAITPAQPVVHHVATLARRALPMAGQLSTLLVDLRDRGGFEGLGDLVYSLANMASGYDANSHFVAVAGSGYARCILANLTPDPNTTPGCSHAYGEPENGHIPATQGPSPAGGGMRHLAPKQINALLDYLLG